MSGPTIGQRVMFVSLMLEGQHPGVIQSADFIPFGEQVVTVKLERQEKPVGNVLYFDTEPEVVNSSRCQICWPAEPVSNID